MTQGASAGTLAVVIPTLDEVTAIGPLTASLRHAGVCCVIVVDSGSTDGTQRVAAAAGAAVVDEPRRGYGRACLTGIERALDPAGHRHDAVAFVDGDGSCRSEDVLAVAARLSDAHVVLGRRRRRGIAQGAMPWHARLGNGLVAAIVSIRTGRRVRDLPPVKAVRSEALAGLALTATGYAWTVQLVARALVHPGLRVVEVDVGFARRVGGTSKVSGSVGASVRAARQMLIAAVHESRPRRRPILALMAKAPRPGHAKTRLSRDLGDGLAMDLWAACLADTAENVLTAAAEVRGDAVAYVPSVGDASAIADLLGPGWRVQHQLRPGLSAALAQVFTDAFDQGADRALAIAGDVPHLPPAELAALVAALDQDQRRAVIAPSHDQGYNAIGLRWRPAGPWWPAPMRRLMRRRLVRHLDAIFDQVTVTGADIASATRGALVAHGWRVTVTSPTSDLDTAADLTTLAATIRGDGRWSPRTARWLERHRDLIASGES